MVETRNNWTFAINKIKGNLDKFPDSNCVVARCFLQNLNVLGQLVCELALRFALYGRREKKLDSLLSESLDSGMSQ